MDIPTAHPLGTRPQRRRRSRPFTLWIVGLVAALVVAGFARTFFLRPWIAGPPLTRLAIVHGVVMSLWVVLFATQAWLVRRNNVAMHRRLGVLGMLLVPLMLGLGLVMAVQAMRAGRPLIPGVTPQQFLIIPLCNIVLFSALAGTGLWLRKRPQAHRRLMLLALLSLLPPAIARIPLDLVRAGGLPLVMGVGSLIILACALRDAAVNRRLHPAFVYGGLPAILTMPVSLVIARTPWWPQLAGLLM